MSLTMFATSISWAFCYQGSEWQTWSFSEMLEGSRFVKKLEVAQRVDPSSVSIAFSRVVHRFKEGSDLPRPANPRTHNQSTTMIFELATPHRSALKELRSISIYLCSCTFPSKWLPTRSSLLCRLLRPRRRDRQPPPTNPQHSSSTLLMSPSSSHTLPSPLPPR